MICEKCNAAMRHNYCETWVTGGDPYEPVEYITLKGYWSCDGCPNTIDETDDNYEPEP